MRRIFGVSASAAIVDLLSFLLRPAAFFVRIWRANAWRLLTLPLAVNLKRFAAPLWVFSFMCRFLCFWAAFGLLWREYGDQIRTFHFRPCFDRADVCQFLDQTIQKSPADALVHDLSSPEEDSCFDLIALFQEPD